jgi:hypothetical protein
MLVQRFPISLFPVLMGHAGASPWTAHAPGMGIVPPAGRETGGIHPSWMGMSTQPEGQLSPIMRCGINALTIVYPHPGPVQVRQNRLPVIPASQGDCSITALRCSIRRKGSDETTGVPA